MSHKSLFPHNNIQFRLERAKYEFKNARSQKKEHSQIEQLRVHYAKCCLSWVFFHGGGEEYLSEVMTLLRKPNIDNSIEKGIYVYKVLVQSQNDKMISEKSQKLIILR